ncbi:MAG: hypothetical protein GY928_09355 [Colwellia sp.]|nr:hypothetical protein [Colwellia sp.]
MNLKQLTLKASNTRDSPTVNVIMHDRDVLLVNGYIHKYCAHFSERICNKTYDFYRLKCALIKFSKTYKSMEGWRFSDGQTCIKTLTVAATEMDSTDEREEYQNYKWILCELSNGGQSWCAETVLYRIWLRNPNKCLIVLGVCDTKRMFKSDKELAQKYGVRHWLR